MEELHELGYRSHFERSSVEIYETVERAKVQIGLAPEFAALECPDRVIVEGQKRALSCPHNGGRMCHSMFEACSRHVRGVFVNGFWQCYNFIV